VGGLLWVSRSLLIELDEQGCLDEVILDAKLVYLRPEMVPTAEESGQPPFEMRKTVMKHFLCFDTLAEGILPNRNLGDLVRAAMRTNNVSKSFVYKLWSQMCLYGFSENSLKLQLARCGAPGVSKPVEKGGRKKPGRKTNDQRMRALSNLPAEPVQPGVSQAWITRTLATDRRIPSPKPSMPLRAARIVDLGFSGRLQDVNGKLEAMEPPIGTYPNVRQIRRILEREIPRLDQVLQATTTGHFTRSKRGLQGKSWKNVPGPGHTYAIDSTVGDIYLRSSLNPSWIVGRPVVYTIVDVWSTAVVGFFVCLQGPSWGMAKHALFSVAAPIDLWGNLWGIVPTQTLFPAPTLCAVLMCDRGEYLSIAARATAFKCFPTISFAPPYRPDLKGLVEVLHRIAKDRMFRFIPGAIDARRQEMELRRFHPEDGVLTVRDFVGCLHQTYVEYNLSADRSNKLDSYMQAEGAIPTPAGLWRWGHAAHIGYRKQMPEHELISSMLLAGKADITRNGVRYAGGEFASEETRAAQWTGLARNFGSWSTPCFRFQGSSSRIWVPNQSATGLLQLASSEQSAVPNDLTFDEVADAKVYSTLKNPTQEHQRMMATITRIRAQDAIIQAAKERMAQVLKAVPEDQPNMTQARQLENAYGGSTLFSQTEGEEPPGMEPEEYEDDCRREMNDILEE